MAIKSKKGRISPRERVRIRIRKRVSGTVARPRLSVFRSAKHLYVQLVDDISGKTLAAASTLDKEVMSKVTKLDLSKAHNKATSSKSSAAARAVGLVLAEKSKQKNIVEVVFDRNGFLYHGRIKAVADGAREGGLKF